MSESNQCPECQTALPRGATEGLCPKCLMGAAMMPSDEVVEPGSGSEFAATTPQAGGFVPPQPEELVPLFPQLEIIELLGHGGMGAVYKARQTKLDRLVALKIIRPESADDAAFAERFMREARTLARLNHPNIVAVHDFGETGKLYYFVMEYVDGMNLRQVMQAGELQPDNVLAVVPQICEALQFAHDEGIVHRDIKPENILVDSRGRVKIADFGLARLVASSPQDFTLTGTHQVMGTPRYMAPEQMEGSHNVDHRADIYSLGVVFYEMLTGEIPAGHFEPPSKKVQIDNRLDEVVLRALAREPERRYQKADDVRSDVEAITSTNSLVSQPGMSAVSYPHGASTILEQGVGRIAEGVRQGFFGKILENPATQGVLAMLLCIGGVATVFIPWGWDQSPSGGRWIHAYDHPCGSIAGVVFFALALALLASTTSRKRPAWRPWIIMLTGGIALGLIALFHANMLPGSVLLEGSFFTASSLSVALMLVGAWDVRLLLAQWSSAPNQPVRPKEPKKKATAKEENQNAHLGFTVTGIEDIGEHVISHFSLLGYQYISEQPGEWIFQRGKKSAALWEADIYVYFTKLTVRSGPQPGGGCWVTCGWDVTTWGMAYVSRKDIAKLKAEGHELETLLLRDSSPGLKREFENAAENSEEFQQTNTPVTNLTNEEPESIQTATNEHLAKSYDSSTNFAKYDMVAIRSEVGWPSLAMMIVGFLMMVGHLIASIILMNTPNDDDLIVFGVPGIVFGLMMFVGGLNMRYLWSLGWAGLGATAGLVALSPAWVLSMPIYFWAKKVLNRPHVQAAFAEQAREREHRSNAPTMPGFSRKAIIGTLLVPAFVVSLVPVLFAIRISQVPVFATVLIGLPALVMTILTTYLGIAAIGDIRHSRGRLTGLGMAFFDAVCFPTLIINVLVAVVGLLFVKMGIGMSELLILAIIAAPFVVLANVLVLRWLWNGVKSSEYDSPRRRSVG